MVGRVLYSATFRDIFIPSSYIILFVKMFFNSIKKLTTLCILNNSKISKMDKLYNYTEPKDIISFFTICRQVMSKHALSSTCITESVVWFESFVCICCCELKCLCVKIRSIMNFRTMWNLVGTPDSGFVYAMAKRPQENVMVYDAEASDDEPDSLHFAINSYRVCITNTYIHCIYIFCTMFP
jgi:hypothetical protein